LSPPHPLPPPSRCVTRFLEYHKHHNTVSFLKASSQISWDRLVDVSYISIFHLHAKCNRIWRRKQYARSNWKS
jgi:hypothetical protein